MIWSLEVPSGQPNLTSICQLLEIINLCGEWSCSHRRCWDLMVLLGGEADLRAGLRQQKRLNEREKTAWRWVIKQMFLSAFCLPSSSVKSCLVWSGEDMFDGGSVLSLMRGFHLCVKRFGEKRSPTRIFVSALTCPIPLRWTLSFVYLGYRLELHPHKNNV